MWVVATRLGYYGIKRRKAGDVFRLKDEKHFSKVWMRPHDESAETDDSLDDVEEMPPVAVKKGRPKKVRATHDDVVEGTSQSDEDVI